MEIDDLLSKALIRLLVNNDNCFWANILMNLKRSISTEIPTAAVSNTELFINAEFWKSIPIEIQEFVLLHEASHLVYQDINRAQSLGLCPDKWNRACDYYINNEWKKAGITIWDKCLYDPKYDGWEKIDIYNALDDDGDKDALHGDMQPSDGEVIDDLIANAAIQTKSCGGKIPEGVAKYLEKLYHPKLDWRQLLAKYMNSISKDDYSYKRLNRAYLPLGYAVPTLLSEGFGTLGIAIDTSGSVSDAEYNLFIGGITEILERCNPTEIDVIAFTTHLVNKWKVKDMADIEDLKFRSSGGTSLNPVFEYFNANPPTVLIIFSDMECAPWTAKTNYDVINIVVGSVRYRGVGRTINISLTE